MGDPKEDSDASEDLRAIARPAIFSVRNAIREAGLPETMSSADAIRSLAAEVARLRSRVRVEASDVERAGVTREHFEAWLRTNGWEPLRGAGVTSDGRFVNWTRRAGRYSSLDSVSVFEASLPERIAQSISTLARHHNRPGLDILDEMAAMPVEPSNSTAAGEVDGT